MANASTELATFRQRSTQLLDSMNNIHGALAVLEGAGDTDVERRAFFQNFIDSQQNYDITVDELISVALKLRELRTWLESNLADLSIVRI